MKLIKKLFNKNKNKTQIFDISLQRMQGMIGKMEHEAGWSMNEKMYWGYYFLDHDLKKLEKFANKLRKIGYEIIEIRNTGNDNLYLLHAEEHVVHTPESLFKQCHTLAKLASENELEFFDGWDVEQKQMNKGLVE